MSRYDWKAHADHVERLLRRHRHSRILLTQGMAENAKLCGSGILAWRKATDTPESELTVKEVVRRTLAARPGQRDDPIQGERRLAEWSLWCNFLDTWITQLKRETRKRWLLGMIGLDRSPATVRSPRTGPRAGLPGLPRHQRTPPTPGSQ